MNSLKTYLEDTEIVSGLQLISKKHKGLFGLVYEKRRGVYVYKHKHKQG